MTIHQLSYERISEAFNATHALYIEGHEAVKKLERLVNRLSEKIRKPGEWQEIQNGEYRELQTQLNAVSCPPQRAQNFQTDLALLLTHTPETHSSHLDCYDLATPMRASNAVSITTLSDDAELEATLKRCQDVIRKIQTLIRRRAQETMGDSQLHDEIARYYRAMMHHEKDENYVDEIGEGSFGFVLHYKSHGMHIALKRAFPEKVDVFLPEMRRLLQVDHPNIVPLLDFDPMEQILKFPLATSDMPNYLLDLGDDISSAHRKVQSAIRDIVVGLAYLHSRNLVHLDLKPENILNFDGRLVIADLGACVNSGEKEKWVLPLGYRPPEDILVAYEDEVLPASPKKDIYSLGVILFNVLSLIHAEGRDYLPFTEEFEKLYRAVNLHYPKLFPPEHEHRVLANFLKMKLDDLPNLDWRDAIDPDDHLFKLMMQCLHGYPEQRPSAQNILNHPYFQ